MHQSTKFEQEKIYITEDIRSQSYSILGIFGQFFRHYGSKKNSWKKISFQIYTFLYFLSEKYKFLVLFIFFIKKVLFSSVPP